MKLPGPIYIDTLLIGHVVDYARLGSRSAIDKWSLRDAVEVSINGIVDDEQDDLRVYGGPDRTIHHYPPDHYVAWQADINTQPLLA